MATTTATAKRCVNCHRDVTTGKRMKDSSGRYWCVPCGAADQKKKASSAKGGSGKPSSGKGATTAGEPCGQCGDRYPEAKLSKWGGVKLCTSCVKARTKGPGRKAGFGVGGETDKKKLVMMLGIAAVLAAVSAGRLVFHLF